MGKNLPVDAGDTGPCLSQEDHLEQKMATHPNILLGVFSGQRGLACYSLYGRTELDMTERLSTAQWALRKIIPGGGQNADHRASTAATQMEEQRQTRDKGWLPEAETDEGEGLQQTPQVPNPAGRQIICAIKGSFKNFKVRGERDKKKGWLRVKAQTAEYSWLHIHAYFRILPPEKGMLRTKQVTNEQSQL